MAEARAAVDCASTVMRGYATTTRSATAWLDALDPNLTQTEAAELRGTDPNAIPERLAPAPPEIEAGSNGVAAVAQVSTTAGKYRLLLTRSGTTWLVAHISPPPGAR